MKWMFVVGLSFCLNLSSFAEGFDHQHSAFTSVLKKYQDASSGLVRYAQLKADLHKDKNHPLLNYLKNLEGVKLSEFKAWTSEQKKSFLINAYNAFTIQLIIDNYPVKSIKKIGGFFTKPWSVKFFKLFDGKIESLDPIEHEWLRPQFKDYRIHAAVNCASISCPPLRNEAYTPDKLNAQLDEQMKNWLSDKSRNDLTVRNSSVSISKIFDWYKSDFNDWGGGVKAVLSKHSGHNLNQVENLKYLEYNWDLNQAK